jgi:hypothetical protein
MNVAWIDLYPLAFILHFFWSAVCVMQWLVTSTAVLSAKVAVIDSGEDGKYSNYKYGPRTLPRGMPTLTEESSVYSFSTFMRSVCYRNRILG